MEIRPKPCQATFCDLCAPLTTAAGLRALPIRDGQQGHPHRNRKELRDSARDGCSFCFWILAAIEGQKWSSERVHLFEYMSAGVVVGLLGRVVEEHHNDSTKATRNNHDPIIIFESYVWSRSLLSFLDPDTQVFDMGCQSSMARAKMMLRKCLQSHKSCPRDKATYLPTRVIKIGLNGNTYVPRLHISGMGERGSYVALSYCWGGDQNYITSMATVRSQCEGIYMNNLPYSIQDAIRVTAGLGIEYLWVDAICIIQDSSVDKATEINNMCEIYKNAKLSISAASSSSVYDGFLWKIPMATRDVDGVLRHPLTNTGFNGRSMDDGPLHRRGWALQENMLSSRILSFQSYRLEWQCNTTRVTDAFRNPVSSLSSIAGEKDTDLQHRHWISIVERYSQCSLSLSEDRLPALAGIAKEIGMHWNDVYLAGIWRKTAIHCETILVAVEAPMGQVKSGKLRIRGPFLRKPPKVSMEPYTDRLLEYWDDKWTTGESEKSQMVNGGASTRSKPGDVELRMGFSAELECGNGLQMNPWKAQYI
ncbi:hypothetical protein BP5796_03328 [Coleophoma crateriformis]|uniref:Heterokaryon incompatibility domain-containing protein n=1 Tax=Coleophoma crateriformis TaxID=565419 RepID=A0A3D8SN77_9HELO|nr:hypothetical protein BP5796_03328 [Coleophoma crateriformis]